VFPAKGHLATIASKVQCEYNITLKGGAGYAAPMAISDSEGRYLYRLSGFVDFDLSNDTNFDRIEALVDATRVHLPDAELIDASACHRPISADDRPIVGPSRKYSNLFVCTGFGSRGWSVGLGCGKLLSNLMLGLPCEIDPTPLLPSRFG
jgi:D-amino-acid dehydrogenase